jgi:Ca2+-binding RTX toxin-like protein
MNLFRREGRRKRLPVVAFAGVLFAFQAIALVGAQTASAAVTSCSWGSGVLTVNFSATLTISANASGQIMLDAATSSPLCSSIPATTATLTNTTEIDVNGSAGADTLTIDLGVNWGAINWKIDLLAGTDSLVLNGTALTADMDGPIVGASGVDLNDDGDLDATVAGVEGITINCGSGDDYVTGVGSTIAGGPTSIPLTILGGAGYDDLGGGLGNDTLTVGADGGAVDYLGFPGPITANLGGVAPQITGAGSDTTDATDITGSDGNDTITGLAADDNDIAGGPGDDTIDGGLGGEDTADFWDSAEAVTVSLTAGTATGDGTDTLKNMEDVYGSDFGDTIAGDKGDNYLDGAAGSDWVDYGDRSGDLLVCLNTSTVAGDPCVPGTSGDTGTTEADTLVHIENAILGSGDDVFEGNAFSNVVEPNGGQNVLDGLGGGDTLDYSVGYDTGVEVNMAGGGTAGDSAVNFENVIGTDFADTIVGSDSSNTIRSRKGNDNVRAGAGDDTVKAGAGNDLVRAGTGDDDLWGQKGNDNLNGGKGSDFCKGGPGKDLIRGCESGHK